MVRLNMGLLVGESASFGEVGLAGAAASGELGLGEPVLPGGVLAM